MTRLRFALFATIFAAACSCAATTTVWETTGYSDFIRGQMNGLSITRDGRMIPGPVVQPFFSTDQHQIWSAVEAQDGVTYVGTGDRGRVYKIDANGRGTLLWTAPEPEVFALAIDKSGFLYAGTSPNGKVYRIDTSKPNAATEYFSPGEPFIWALAIAPDGTLYVGTGQQGKIYRVPSEARGSAAGRGEIYYETGQEHVTSLAIDNQGRLIAGTASNGIVYRITSEPGGNSKGFVLYDSSLPEIRTITPMPDGSIYVSALGGSLARRTGAATTSTNNTTTMITAPATSITVTADQSGLVQPPKPEAPKTTSLSTPTPNASATVTETTGIERSALYRIERDNTVETLWSSKEDNLYDVLPQSSSEVLLLTDNQGRIYGIDPRPGTSHSPTLLSETNESDPTRLLRTKTAVLAAVGSSGKLIRLDTSSGDSAPRWFESPVHDAGAVSRWGRLSTVGGASGVTFKTRSGNSARPDATWSDWGVIASTGQINSPNARFIQWRAEFSNAAGSGDAAIDDVSVAFLPQNTAPNVRSITLSSLGSGSAKTQTTSAGTSSAFSVTVTDTSDAPAAAQTQIFPRPAGQQLQISWQADDPEGDKLVYDVYMRSVADARTSQNGWVVLREGLTDNTYLLEGDSLADGRYQFRVVASDRPSNPADQARQSELISPPVLIDNTPPTVTVGTPTRSGQTVEIDVSASDQMSSLRRCEYIVDAQQPWQPVEATNGITDAPTGKFVIRVANLSPGDHIVTVRVVDAAGNAGLAKIIIR